MTPQQPGSHCRARALDRIARCGSRVVRIDALVRKPTHRGSSVGTGPVCGLAAAPRAELLGGDRVHPGLAQIRGALPEDEGAELSVPVLFWWWQANVAQEMARMMPPLDGKTSRPTTPNAPLSRLNR